MTVLNPMGALRSAAVRLGRQIARIAGGPAPDKLKVVEGATLRCSQGDCTAPIQLDVCRVESIDGKSVCHISDHKSLVNIQPFGTCKVTGSPCVPITPIPWISPVDVIMGESDNVLIEGSTLLCLKAGIITIEDPGQCLVCADAYGEVVVEEVPETTEPEGPPEIELTNQLDFNGTGGWFLCGAGSVTHAMRLLGLEADFDQIANEMMQQGIILQDLGMRDGNAARDYFASNPDVNAEATYHSSFDRDFVSGQLDGGSVVVTQVYNHWTVIGGYRDNEDGSRVYRMYDSYQANWANSNVVVNQPLSEDWVSEEDLGAMYEAGNGYMTTVSRSE